MTLVNIACQTNKNMNNERKYLIHLLKEKGNHSKYLFSDGYEPFIMTRKGFDYVDAHMTSSATNDFFVFEEGAVSYKKSFSPLESKETLLRCLYINEKGLIGEVIKRKINVVSVDLDSLDIEQEDIQQGISRLYNEKILVEVDVLMSEIISTEEFCYFLIEKKKNDICIYKIEILNDDNRDLVCSNAKEHNCKEIYFHQAQLLYDEEGNFIDLEIIVDNPSEEVNLEDENDEDEDLPRI